MRMSYPTAPSSENEQAHPPSDSVILIIEWTRGRSVGDLLREQSSLPLTRGAGALPTTALKARNDFIPLPRTREVIRKFDRDTGWVATAVLAMLILGALGLAMQVKESHFSDNAPLSNGADHRPGNVAPPP
jgi:hypothetical protein